MGEIKAIGRQTLWYGASWNVWVLGNWEWNSCLETHVSLKLFKIRWKNNYLWRVLYVFIKHLRCNKSWKDDIHTYIILWLVLIILYTSKYNSRLSFTFLLYLFHFRSYCSRNTKFYKQDYLQNLHIYTHIHSWKCMSSFVSFTCLLNINSAWWK